MGLFDKLFRKEPTFQIEAEPKTLYLPIAGEVIPLREIGDGVFSDEVLGKGFGIRPCEQTAYAPVSGSVTSIADTKHAIGLLSDDGIEVLIHVGMDTVEMNGESFSVLVKEGQKVACGQPILKFDVKKIEAAGHPTTTAVVVTNSDDYSDVSLLSIGSKEKLISILKVK